MENRYHMQGKDTKTPVMQVLNLLLGISFLGTMLVPLTGIHVHKMASALFLLLCIIHTVVYRRRMGRKRYLMLTAVLIAFASGIFGMILDPYPIVLQLHKAVSILSVCFLAIHSFLYHKSLFRSGNGRK